MYKAKVILDSISPFDQRLITVEATYPRFIHSELLTHRDRERNSASSRAIPWMTYRPKFKHETDAEYAMNKAEGGIDIMNDKCMKKMILTDPVVPLTFGAEQRGMQAGGVVPPQYDDLARKLWLLGRDFMVNIADLIHNIGNTYDKLAQGDLQLLAMLQNFGLDTSNVSQNDSTETDLRIHKSLCNRLTEPWMWITVVMTATEWNNFFRLRCHPAAEQHFFHIACMIREEIRKSKPTRLNFGEYHLPYVDLKEEIELLRNYADTCGHPWDILGYAKRISVARCARVSYLSHDGRRDFSNDMKLFGTLLKPPGDPDEDIMHASPFGHVAEPTSKHHRSGPFIGWKQFRKEFANENVPGCTV